MNANKDVVDIDDQSGYSFTNQSSAVGNLTNSNTKTFVDIKPSVDDKSFSSNSSINLYKVA